MTEDTQPQTQASADAGATSPDAGATSRSRVFKKQIDQCKLYRRKLVADWRTSIDYRRGKPFASQTDEDRIVVNLDWPLTKAKQASLFSQVPQVRVNHPPDTLNAGPWVSKFEQRLNDTLVTAGIEAAMDEVLPDVINAAGIGVVLVSHEAITEMHQVPKQDLTLLPQEQRQAAQQSGLMPDGTPIEMISVPVVVDHRYRVDRVSPADFLWPIGFTASDFDKAPWEGRSGREPWENAKRLFKLDDSVKDRVVKTMEKAPQDRLTDDADRNKEIIEEVNFDEIFYKEFLYNSEAKSYYTLRRMVFVDGLDEPVIDQPWEGQRTNPDGTGLLGSFKTPLRVLTLTYITDEAIPPSDSAIGRPQVNEIIKSRTQMIQQRERNLPLRWFNVDRVDPTIQTAMMHGTWQGMIPVQGDGDRAIGEVARANMPQEDFTFNNIAKGDLNDAWQIGPNQQGTFGQGRQSASEANLVESNFQTRIGRERAKVSKFFVSIAEVLGGLMCLFEEPTSFGEGFTPEISRTLAYSILADSTVLIDSQQRLQRLVKFLDMTAKSGWVDVGSVIKEIATLSGLDPNVVVKPPTPPPPDQPNISLRLTGIQDLYQPLALAMLMKSGQAPTPELIEQAKSLIQLGSIAPLNSPQGAAQAPPGLTPGGTQGGPIPEPPPPGVGEANSGMELMSKVNARSDDGRPNS